MAKYATIKSIVNILIKVIFCCHRLKANNKECSSGKKVFMLSDISSIQEVKATVQT